MQNRIVLVSDDIDFFEYMRPKFRLRKSDEIYTFSYDKLINKLHLFVDAIFILNTENSNNKFYGILNLLSELPIIVFSYNENPILEKEVFTLGAFAFITMENQDEEIFATIKRAHNYIALIKKNQQYRQILVKNQILENNKEIYTNYNIILEEELEKIKENSSTAVLLAFTIDEKSKFIIEPAQIETCTLNSIRKLDLFMRYAPHKYFILLHDTDIDEAKLIIKKIQDQLPFKIYAGFENIMSKSRQKNINGVLNKLHHAITSDASITTNNLKVYSMSQDTQQNFKKYKHELNKNLEKIISLAFFSTEQKYATKLLNVRITQEVKNGIGTFCTYNDDIKYLFRINILGFSKVNIDIILEKQKEIVETKNILIDANELEPALLEDLLEQFMVECKNIIYNKLL